MVVESDKDCRPKLLNDIYLCLNVNAKLFKNSSLNVFRNIQDFLSCSMTIIDQNQSLIFMDSGITKTFSFEASLLNQPACRHFYCSFRNHIMRYFRMQGVNFIELCF